MLRAVEHDAAHILAIAHRHAQRNVVAGAELVHEPANAMGFLTFRVLMAGHDAQRGAWPSTAAKFPVLSAIVPSRARCRSSE